MPHDFVSSSSCLLDAADRLAARRLLKWWRWRGRMTGREEAKEEEEEEGNDEDEEEEEEADPNATNMFGHGCQ